jgi:hypothetical protein
MDHKEAAPEDALLAQAVGVVRNATSADDYKVNRAGIRAGFMCWLRSGALLRAARRLDH